MNKIVWFFLLLCSLNASAQNFENQILSDFEREIYNSSEGVVLNYKFVNSHTLALTGQFIQVYIVEAINIDDAVPPKKALVISHSSRRDLIGKHDFIDADEVDGLINALEYFLENLAGTKPKDHQSFMWTSRGGYQIQATCAMDFPKRYTFNSRLDHFNSSSNGATVYNKQVEKLIVSLKGAKVMLK